MLRLFIADDHPLIRLGIRHALTEITVVGEAGTGDELLQRLPRQSCDVLLLDLALPDQRGIDLIPKVKSSCPYVRIIVFSMFDEPQYARQALLAGAVGFVVKTASMKELNTAIHKVIAGQIYLSYHFRDDDLIANQEPPSSKSLSAREQQVLELIAVGKPIRDIAESLALSPKTIATHRTHIMDKLQLSSTAALVRYAVSHSTKSELKGIAGVLQVDIGISNLSGGRKLGAG